MARANTVVSARHRGGWPPRDDLEQMLDDLLHVRRALRRAPGEAEIYLERALDRLAEWGIEE